MAKASMLELTQLSDSSGTKKVWINIPLIQQVQAMQNNTWLVQMQSGAAFNIDAANFTILKNAGFEIP